VAGPRPRRAMRPYLAVRVGRIAVPVALVMALSVGMAGAVSPGGDAQVAPASIRSKLVVSLNPDRSSAVRLDGSTVEGNVYVFVRKSKALDKVDFYLDGLWPTDAPSRTEEMPPFDLAGTAADGTALPYDTTNLANGSHTIRAVLTWSDGTTSSRRGDFTVANSGPTAPPTTTTTTAPTTTPPATATPTMQTPVTTTPTATPSATSAYPTLASTAPSTTSVTPTTPAATPTTTTPAPTTTTGSPSGSKCSFSGAVPIGVGDDAQMVVNAHGAGTTYVVKAGTHLRNFSVRPRSGDKFCGEPGAVLDGGRSLQFAFSGQASNVTLDSITVQNYNTGWQGGAIQPDTHASGWVVRNVSALRNYWAGLMAADGMKILGGHYNDNDQLGIGGNSATGVLLDGLDGDTATFDGPELARNHALHASPEYEAGGMKWDVGQVTIRNVHAHHNDYRGLWADMNARGALIEHNLVEDNWAEGVFYEISQDAVIRNNQIYSNGIRAETWYWDGGITVASSFNVEVYGNRLSGNHNGITGTQQDRPDSTPPAHLLDNYQVHDNLICATGGPHPTGVVSDNGANLAARNISFTGNTIQSSGCEQSTA
jgi:hypothetical protein